MNPKLVSKHPFDYVIFPLSLRMACAKFTKGLCHILKANHIHGHDPGSSTSCHHYYPSISHKQVQGGKVTHFDILC